MARRASPITACAVGYILLMCSSSTLQWMMVFFAASGMAWLKRPGDRLEPMINRPDRPRERHRIVPRPREAWMTESSQVKPDDDDYEIRTR
jgi:hypothetical protein